MSTQNQPDSAQRVAQTLANADRARRAGNKPEAERLCRQILAADPQSPQALNYLALLVRDRGELVEAEALLRRAIAASPREAALYNNLGNLQHRRGDIPAAELSLRTALNLNPAYPEACYNLGLVLRDAGFPKESLDAHRRAVALNPAYVDAHVQIGVLMNDAGNLEDALRAFDAAIRTNAKSFDAHYYRSSALTGLERFDDAIRSLRTALSLKADNAAAHHALGNTFAKAGREEEAFEEYRKALDLAPASLEVHRDYNALAWESGRRDLNLKSYAAARERIGQNPDLLLAEANQRLLHEESEMAEDLLRRAHDTAPDRVDITNALARALTMRKKFDEAVSLLAELVRTAPNHTYNHRDAAIALLQMGEAREAARYLEQALALDPLDQLNLAHLTLAYRELGDSRLDALADLEKLVGVYDIAPPAGFNDVAAFNRSLSEELASLHKRQMEPFDQTLRGGTQTPGYLFAKRSRALEGVREKIREAVGDYVGKLTFDPNHPMLARKSGTFDFATAWSCRLRSSGFHTNHVHQKGWISSAYYASLPDVVTEGSDQQGWLKFGESNLGLSERDRPGRAVKPGVGKLVLFPSYFWHGTVPFTSDDMRLTIAFDVVPGKVETRTRTVGY
jgi:tetratricopeptide (TPR) repeat protein